MNLTNGRVVVLLKLCKVPGIYASGIADLFPRMSSDGRMFLPWTKQGATRWGCGYMQPLVDAGLVSKDSRVRTGGARYFITAHGRAVLTAWKKSR